MPQCLAVIGDQFENRDEICGIVLSLRPHEDILALWTRTAADNAAQLAIRCVIRFFPSDARPQHAHGSDEYVSEPLPDGRGLCRDTLKALLYLPPDTLLEYKQHNSSLQDKSSFRNTDKFR